LGSDKSAGVGGGANIPICIKVGVSRTGSWSVSGVAAMVYTSADEDGKKVGGSFELLVECCC